MLNNQVEFSEELNTKAKSQQDAYKIIERDLRCGILVLCDHACALIPEQYNNLGLNGNDLNKHISYDIGAATLADELADQLGANLIISNFSRLLIDPNRGLDDPTLIMQIADNIIVPGNVGLTQTQRQARINQFYEPYHQAIDTMIDKSIATGKPPFIVSIHSFTPVFRNITRPMHAGVLWDKDPRLAMPLIAKMQSFYSELAIGDNEPYDGALRNDCLYQHGTNRGLANAIIEVRQDLISSDANAKKWGREMATIIGSIAQTADLHKIKLYGSRSH